VLITSPARWADSRGPNVQLVSDGLPCPDLARGKGLQLCMVQPRICIVDCISLWQKTHTLRYTQTDTHFQMLNTPSILVCSACYEGVGAGGFEDGLQPRCTTAKVRGTSSCRFSMVQMLVWKCCTGRRLERHRGPLVTPLPLHRACVHS
jgi:hypothetical protein